MFWNKNKKKHYFRKVDEIKTWQFTKGNFKEGAPRWVRCREEITLWSQYAGRIIGGEVEDGIIMTPITEGDWIVLLEGKITIYNPVRFEEEFCFVETKGGEVL